MKDLIHAIVTSIHLISTKTELNSIEINMTERKSFSKIKPAL